MGKKKAKKTALELIGKKLKTLGLAPALSSKDAKAVAAFIQKKTGGCIYPQSIAFSDGTGVCIRRDCLEKTLVAFGYVRGFDGESLASSPINILVCPLSHTNALLVREMFPFTKPVTLGIATSFGAGDRLGIATPGHIIALKKTGVRPILAQQSIREMERTNRSPEQVIDCATWGVLQEGFRDGFGSDADHLKTTADIDRTAAAGFTMFTIDPKAHVDDGADGYDIVALASKADKLPWKALGETAADNKKRYVGVKVKLPNKLAIDAPSEEEWLRAAVKYGRAVVHTVAMKKHIESVMKSKPWELEMSVDETDSPTTVFEHYYVANELKRLGVSPVSLAPRFIGRFEKGVDYIGDIKKLETAIKYHHGISQLCGPYKLSLHSGSDKFSVYPIAAKACDNLVHVKTAGTSYLEAVRAIAKIKPALYKRIVAFAHERYETDKQTYHVSADPKKAPTALSLKKGKLAKSLDQFDLRQMLHVTFGSVLTTKVDGAFAFYDEFINALKDKEDVHYETVAKHIKKHVKPFAARLRKKTKKRK